MDGIAIKAMVSELAPVIREYAGEATKPLLARIAALEAGKTALEERCEAVETAAEQILADYRMEAAEEFKAWLAADGEQRDASLREEAERGVAFLKTEHDDLKERIKTLEDRPAPEFDPAPVGEMIEAEIAKLPAPEPVKEIDREELATMVSEAIAALPVPQDGKSVTVDDVAPLIIEEVAKATDPRDINLMVGSEVAKAVAAIPVPKDGKDAPGFVDVLKDNGELVLTLQDGRVVRTGIRDGKDGDPGRDGFGFDDMDVAVLDDDRTIELSFRRGDDEKVFTAKWPTVIDRGPFKIDRETPYEPGDGVTWGGQFYIANEQTNDKPDQSKDGKPWRLAVRKGRDGKDARKDN